jgi:phage/plasmid-like protein (TIGR03299 family)
MGHALDITDGQASFVSAHTMGWHQLGQLLDHSFTAEEAMKEGHLGGWNVRKVPVSADLPDGTRLPIAGMNAVVRDNPVRKGQIDVLSRSNVSDGFQIIQNEQHAGLLNALVDESGAHFDTAGALYGGSQVFITMKLPGHINVGGVDPIDTYIAAINSHDGSMSFTLMVTPIRVVCANTLNLAFENKSHIFRIRHTSGAEAALHSKAREALDLTFNYLDGFQEEADRLVNTTMTQMKFESILAREFFPGEDASQAAFTRSTKKIEEMVQLFADAGTQKGIRDTAWAGMNAMTEWYDHFSPTRGDDKDNSRAQKALFDPSYKEHARKLMLQYV